MKKIRNVKLEILRHGPPHNQLLSPLTNYLALSGRHEAVPVLIPYEHWNFLTLLRALRYQEGDVTTRRTQVKEVADAICRIFSMVPGMISDISNNCSREELVQLRLIFSASELAMLPFELGIAPAGFPGEGLPLSLQLDSPIVVTRQIRGADGYKVPWVRKPRILFAAAAPQGIGSVPFEAHLAALRKALDPWIGPLEPGQSQEERLRESLIVLEAATLEQIQDACAHQDFTHIHILAHGAITQFGRKDTELAFNQDLRFGLALHSAKSGETYDIVEGDRLAQAIRCHRRNPCSIGSLSQPVVVTVASCDSGNQGSVVLPGSSLAHSLHAAGIPIVVASLFPLSKRGSVTMVQTLYSRLLWGEDPRVCLHELRQSLRGQDQETHDWASVVAYASLPDDIDAQLKQLRSLQAREGMRTALTWERYYTEKVAKKNSQQHADSNDDQNAILDLKKNIRALETAIEKSPDRSEKKDAAERKHQFARIDLLGNLGSAEKRRALACMKLADAIEAQMSDSATSLETQAALENDFQHYRNKALEAVDAARNYYRRAYEVNRRSHWAATQFLSLEMFVTWTRSNKVTLDQGIWKAAKRCAEEETRNSQDAERAYAYASCLELDFIALSTDWKDLIPSSEQLTQTAENFIAQVRPRTIEVRTTAWQFERYKALSIPPGMSEAADLILKVLNRALEGKPKGAESSAKSKKSSRAQDQTS